MSLTNLHNIMLMEKGYSDESSLGTSWSSSLNTPSESELGSTKTEDDEDFMAELTRQMANYMLQDEDNVDDKLNGSITPKSFSENSKMVSANKWSDCNSTSIYYCEQRDMTTSFQPHTRSCTNQTMQHIQVYQLINQPTVKEISTKQFNSQGLQLHQQKGSRMKAVLLRGSGYGSSGTGVFLPRVIDYQTDQSRNIPTGISQQKKSPPFSTRMEHNNHDMLLPEEWTY